MMVGGSALLNSVFEKCLHLIVVSLLSQPGAIAIDTCTPFFSEISLHGQLPGYAISSQVFKTRY